MKKFKLTYDKNKEIAWLNEMADQGWNLTHYGCGLYSFQPCQPGQYVYETDLKDKAFSISPEYRSLLESDEIEIIPSCGFWFLARRRKDLGPFSLYTDLPSRIAQYKRIRRMFRNACLFELLLMMIELYLWSISGKLLALFFVILLGVLAIVLFQALRHTTQEIARMEARGIE